MMCGGHSEMSAMTDEVKEITLALKSAMEAQLGSTFATFEPVKYTTQVVAGINYKVKVNVGTGYVHAVIYKPLPHTGAPPSLTSCEGGKAEGDAL
mmetsp:Transcript_797/g.2372  ORF Transcript_797/g.2372 Transcript_797/m.2372 type:complete len:95 (+) Transcript_797:101-385(+)